MRTHSRYAHAALEKPGSLPQLCYQFFL